MESVVLLLMAMQLIPGGASFMFTSQSSSAEVVPGCR